MHDHERGLLLASDTGADSESSSIASRESSFTLSGTSAGALEGGADGGEGSFAPHIAGGVAAIDAGGIAAAADSVRAMFAGSAAAGAGSFASCRSDSSSGRFTAVPPSCFAIADKFFSSSSSDCSTMINRPAATASEAQTHDRRVWKIVTLGITSSQCPPPASALSARRKI